MVSRMIADSFSIDMYCAYLNLPMAEEFTDESEGNRSMSLESSTTRISTSSRPARRPGYVLSRLIWLAIGPEIMMMLCVLKLESHSNVPGAIDVGFLAVATIIPLMRWGTWLAGDKCDSFGRRVSLNGILGFTAIVVAMSSSIWILVNLLAAQQIAT